MRRASLAWPEAVPHLLSAPRLRLGRADRGEVAAERSRGHVVEQHPCSCSIVMISRIIVTMSRSRIVMVRRSISISSSIIRSRSSRSSSRSGCQARNQLAEVRKRDPAKAYEWVEKLKNKGGGNAFRGHSARMEALRFIEDLHRTTTVSKKSGGEGAVEEALHSVPALQDG